MRANNFVSLKHYPDFALQPLPSEDAPHWAQISEFIDERDPASCLSIIDVHGADSIRSGCALQREKSIKPVLTFNTPLHPCGLVGGTEYISALLFCGELLEPVDPRGFAFILDYDRFGDYDDEEMRRRFNNQYELIDEDLPPAEMLKELGFHHVLYIHQKAIKEDCARYLEYLTAEGHQVATEKVGGEEGHG
jgi:hypothetical protein